MLPDGPLARILGGLAAEDIRRLPTLVLVCKQWQTVLTKVQGDDAACINKKRDILVPTLRSAIYEVCDDYATRPPRCLDCWIQHTTAFRWCPHACNTTPRSNVIVENAMRRGAKRNFVDVVDICISRGAHNWNNGMGGAALGGHGQLVDFFIGKGADFMNGGLWDAALGGHLDLVKFFVDEKGADRMSSVALSEAARGGHWDLIFYFMEEGGGTSATIGFALQTAALGGRKDLVDFFLERTTDTWYIGFTLSSLRAYGAVHHEMVDYIIDWTQRTRPRKRRRAV